MLIYYYNPLCSHANFSTKCSGRKSFEQGNQLLMPSSKNRLTILWRINHNQAHLNVLKSQLVYIFCV